MTDEVGRFFSDLGDRKTLEVDKIVKRVGEEEVILASWSVSGGELS
jgi:L-rhamnose isomerase